MKILILEDDKSFAQKLYKDMFNYFSSISDKITFDLITTNFSALPSTAKYDLCFLDIDLKGDNGIEIAKNIKQSGISNTIVFVTAHQHLVYDALSSQPFFFIRKSFYKNDLNILFDLIDDSFYDRTLVTLKWKGNKQVIKLEDVIYIQTYDHSILLHTITGDFYDVRSLREFMSEIDFIDFTQIQKSYVINMSYLLSYTTNSVILTGNIEISLGRAFRKTFLESYQDYLVR